MRFFIPRFEFQASRKVAAGFLDLTAPFVEAGQCIERNECLRVQRLLLYGAPCLELLGIGHRQAEKIARIEVGGRFQALDTLWASIQTAVQVLFR